MRWLAFLASFSLAVAACGGAPPPKVAANYTADAKRAYDAAFAEFDSHNWLEAQAMMRDVKRKYSYSKYARLAELRIADADFEQEKFAEALRGYKQFAHDHKGDLVEVQYARARTAETQYREIGDSVLMPAAEERDQATVVDSYKEIVSYLRDYPQGGESRRVCLLLDDVTARLVRHEMYVARFYLNKGNYDAAVLRLQYAMRNYASEPVCTTKDAAVAPGAAAVSPIIKTEPPRYESFGLAPDALLLLGETYIKMQRWSEARQSFAAILDRYSSSTLCEQATRYLDELKRKSS